MSEIGILYSEYVEREEEPRKELELLYDELRSVLTAEDYFSVESAVSLTLDQECEASFRAGFRCAMRLICEGVQPVRERSVCHAGL